MRSFGAIDSVFVLDGFERFRCDPARVTVAQNRTLLVAGWVGDERELRAYRRADILIDGRPCLSATMVRRRRDDVSRAYGSRALDFAGFMLVIPPDTLSLGKHELVLSIEGGRSAFSAFAFDVTTAVRLGAPVVASTRFRFTVDAATRFHVGIPGVVRGTVNADPADPPSRLYAIIDGCDACPAQLDVTRDGGPERLPGVTPFLACFVTSRLAFGPHSLRFAALARTGAEIHLSAPIEFSIVPLSIGDLRPRLDDALAPASIDWADVPALPHVTRPAARAFSRGTIVCVRGWAVDPAARDSTKAVYLRFENGATFALAMRGARPDIAHALEMPLATYCGFTGSIATSALETGRNIGRCFAISKDGATGYETEATIQIDVRDRQGASDSNY